MSDSQTSDVDHKPQVARSGVVKSQVPDSGAPWQVADAAAVQLARLNPRLLTPGAMLALQRTVGNSIVNQLRRDGRFAPAPQRKAEVVKPPTPPRASGAYPLSVQTIGPWQPDRIASGTTPGPGAMVVSRFWDVAWDKLSVAQQGVRTAVNAPGAEKAVYAGSPKGGLSAPLQAGLTLAQANPDAAPADPTWLSVQVKKIQNGQYFLTKQNKHVIEPMYPTRFKEQWRNKWAKGHANNEGNKPGLSGAGGYKEYYAEPSPDAATWWDTEKGNQPMGKNRILQQTNSTDGLMYWWASEDHYNTVTFITDA